MKRRIHVLLTEAQYNGLKAKAKERQISVSKMIRLFAPTTDTIRQYIPDGLHTAQKRQ